MEEFVRRAASRDVNELVRLEAEHRAVLLETERGGAEWLRDHPSLGPSGWAELLNDVDSIVVVSGVDAAVLGFAWARVGEAHPAVVRVGSVYVTDGAREVGLGEQMVQALVDWATQREATSIEAEALPGDRQTKNLFERVGLVARLITVSRRLV